MSVSWSHGRAEAPQVNRQPPLILVCIPARNEEKTIAAVLVKARRYADRIVVCDDGSSDLTGDIAKVMGAEVIRSGLASGYGSALSTLFRRAAELDPDVMVLLDADGQHDPDDIPKLVKPLLDDSAEMVIGSRFKADEAKPPMARRLGIRMVTGFSKKLTRLGISDAQSGFRAFKGSALKDLMPAELGMGASVEILMKASERGLRVVEVPVNVDYAGLETSSESPLLHGIDVLASLWKVYSIRHPLRLYGGIGLAALAVGTFFGLWALQVFLAEGRLVTNLAVLSIGAFLVGVFSLFVGIILFTFITIARDRRFM
jgi:glycosyltransferase involved in cell wall biosynthesis